MLGAGFKTGKYGPIGLDIGHCGVKLVQFERKGGVIRVLSASKVAIGQLSDNPEENRKKYIDAIRKGISKGHFRGREVLSTLPNNQLKITNIRLNSLEKNDERDMLVSESEKRFGTNISSESFGYVRAGAVNKGEEMVNEYIIFASSDEVIKEHIAMIEHSGLTLCGIEPIPCALFRSFLRLKRRGDDKEQTSLTIDIGEFYTTVIFGNNSEINFVKQIPIGVVNIDKEVAERLDISIGEAGIIRKGITKHNKLAESCDIDVSANKIVADAARLVAEKIAREISLCIRYYTVTFRGRRADVAFVSGDGAYEDIIVNVLQRNLSVGVEKVHPFSGMDFSDSYFDGDKRGLNCEWSVAAGLGLKGFDLKKIVSKPVLN